MDQQESDVADVHIDEAFRAVLDLRPPAAAVERFYASGAWRAQTPLDDLARWCEESPDRVAIVAHEAGSGVTRVTFRQYADAVERYAGALYELGVRPGSVVAYQLPNRWQACVLLLACMRLAAVAAPIMPTLRERELERVLDRLRPAVVVTVDEWAGFAHGPALAAVAARLPTSFRLAVLRTGGAGADPVDVDFAAHFEQHAWERTHASALNGIAPDPDRVGMVLFTSGTTGEPKATLHTINTKYMGSASFRKHHGGDPGDTLFCPHALTHTGGIVFSILIPLLTGATVVLMDVWEPEVAAPLLAETRTTLIGAAPVFISALAEVVRRRGIRLALCGVATFGTTVPPQVVTEVIDTFGVTMSAFWGLTEASGTLTYPSDPPDWAARSAGRPMEGTELDLRSDGEITDERPARLFIRGAGVCLATIGRDSGDAYVVADHDDGWFETGDLAVPDGRGGIRLAGRAADRVGGVFMIPVNDVEAALLDHPDVDDVAVVGYPDEHGGELACAVIVSRSTPPDLAELRRYLGAQGMTEWYQPSRVEVLAELPRNDSGKVNKERLRRWLRGEVPAPTDQADVTGA